MEGEESFLKRQQAKAATNFIAWRRRSGEELSERFTKRQLTNFFAREREAFIRCIEADPVRAAHGYEYRHEPGESTPRCACCFGLGHRAVDHKIWGWICPVYHKPNRTDVILNARRRKRQQMDSWAVINGAVPGWDYAWSNEHGAKAEAERRIAHDTEFAELRKQRPPREDDSQDSGDDTD